MEPASNTHRPSATLTLIAYVYPLAGINAETLPPEVKKIRDDIKFVGELLPKCPRTYFHLRHDLVCPPSCSLANASKLTVGSMKARYGHMTHMYHLEEAMVDIAQDLYLDFCTNEGSIKKVYIVAGESGAFMVARLMEFIKIYGVDMFYGLSNFPHFWHSVLSGHPEPPSPAVLSNQLRFPIRHVILIRPSLPSPQGLASLIWQSISPRFYSHTVFTPNDVPCRFLWWVRSEGEENSNALIDMESTSTGSMISRVPDAHIFAQEIAKELCVPPHESERRIFVNERISRLHKVVALQEGMSEATKEALMKIEQRYEEDRTDPEAYDVLIDLDLEARELLNHADAESVPATTAFCKHVEEMAHSLNWEGS
ncbi:hypothetical protein CVT26_015585 [Gymnopilus dilepis]|uniref:Uncharacterized protein n=1 Tax=Gymnopilus dilepis TaxID=231916 RepID=A0A409XYU9_9AGAR|nr:hypothetical protein CVT26_015585 [Gymnopilus dilepis]